MKQQILDKYMHTMTRTNDPTFQPQISGSSRVGRATKAVGRVACGVKEARKASSAFMERWLSQGSAGQGAQLASDTKREVRSKEAARAQD